MICRQRKLRENEHGRVYEILSDVCSLNIDFKRDAFQVINSTVNNIVIGGWMSD